MINAAQLAKCMGCSEPEAAPWIPHLEAAGNCYDLLSPLRLAAFLAQAGHETGSLGRLEENLNYSSAGLRATWPNRFSATEALEYQRNPERIANRAYARAELGNGPEESGDGWKFRGGGWLQTTGRLSYRKFGKAHALPTEDKPELIRVLGEPAVMAGAWEWNEKKLNPLADKQDIDLISRRINGGINGLEDRRKRYERALLVLGVI